MKKTLFISVLAAVAALISCQKEVNIESNEKPIVSDNKVILTINATNPESVATKTTMNPSTLKPSWLVGDKVTVLYKQNGSSTWSSSEPSAPLTSASESASFTVTLDDPNEAEDAYAYYPAGNLSPTASAAKINIAAEQHPSSGQTFDGASDILISQAFKPSSTTVNTGFARMGSILRVKIKNADLASEKLLSLSVTGANNLVGDAVIALSNAEAIGLENGSKTVTATYPEAKQFAVGAVDALSSTDNFVYLIVYPQTLASGSTLTIAGETENTTFSRDIVLSQDINLNPGYIVPLNVTISSFTVKEKVFFEERFSKSGGTMDSPAGSIAYDETEWSVTGSSNGAAGAAKFGAASSVGNVTTPNITIPRAFEGQTIHFSFRAVAWKNDRTELNLSATNATLSESSVSMNNDAGHTFKTFDLTLTVDDFDLPISINFLGESSTTNPKVGRFYLDDVLIFYGTKPTERLAAGLTLDSDSATAIIGDDFTEPALNNPNSVSPIVWSSDNEGVATVDGSGNVTAISAGKANISASFAGNVTYKSQVVSYELTVEEAELTASTPSKAAASDNSTTSFTVTSNIGWTASKGTDGDNIIKSVSTDGNTITVTFNENTEAVEKTAKVNVQTTNRSLSAYDKEVTVTQNAKVAYTITWMANGSQHAQNSAEAGLNLVLPSNPTPSSYGMSGFVFVGWTLATSVNSSGSGITYAAAGDNVSAPVTYFAVFAEESEEDETLTIGTNGGSESWTSGEKAASAQVGDVTFTGLGSGGNDTKYYSSDHTWRFYTQSSAGVKVSVPSGNFLSQVIITFNKGVPGTPTNWTKTGSSSPYTFEPNTGIKVNEASFVKSTSANLQISQIEVHYFTKSNYCLTK